MFNKVILVGNLTRDVELRYLPSSLAVAKTGIATNRKFKSQDGQMKDETCFIDITLFGRTAEVANQYLKKGSKVLVEGHLILEQWVDQAGQKRSKHSVTVENMQMLSAKDSSSEYTNSGGYDSYSYDSFDNSNQSSSKPQMSGGYQNGYQNNQYQNNRQSQPQPQQKFESIPEIDINEDDIPF
ncbi:MAG: single-stranded DNA-binding protein [Campylobacterales bacterium]|nr:single-stranded DNA-binding protein [Campylobacterales bacterium]